MSEAALDRGLYFPSYMTDWYRERPFKVAFALSILVHAALIAFVPGFRSIPMETPRVLEVELARQEPPPRLPERPVVQRKAVEPVPLPEPVVAPPQPVVVQPEPVMQLPQPEPPPIARAEIIRAPRVEPKPEFVVPKPELRPQPKVEPQLEARPEPQVEPRPLPPPVARVEPRPQPLPTPTIEPRPEPRVEPKTEVRREVGPAPQVAPPVAQPREEPAAVAPTAARLTPEPVIATPAPPAAVPQPQPPASKIAEATENRLLLTYGQSISKEIKRYQKYPPPAQRRGWQGTAEVLLQIAADGTVTGITLGKSSGYAILDDEALEMVRRASPLPKAPADLRGRALVVTVPIVFRLQS